MRATLVLVLSLIAAGPVAAQDAQDAQDEPTPEQDPEVAAPQPTGPPLDLVLTRDGGMLRGTIVESVPDQYVMITLPTGESRRLEWSAIRYAGPAAGAPQPSAPPTSSLPAPAAIPTPPAEPSGMHVRFTSPQEGIRFHRVTGSVNLPAVGVLPDEGFFSTWNRGHSFEPLCTAPCDMTMEPGEYELALSRGTGPAVVVPGLVHVVRNGTVTGEYLDRSDLRIAGAVTAGVGGAGGLAVMFMPLALLGTGSTNIDIVGWIVSGTVITCVSLIVGLVLGLQGDGAIVRFD